MGIIPPFKTSLIEANEEEDAFDQFNFLDYFPLVNSRAHRMGGSDGSTNKKWILNNQFWETYQKFVFLMT